MRYQCRSAVIETLQANTDLAGVQIERCWPGDQQEAESIWLNPAQGVEIRVPVFRGPASINNPIVIDDTFTIPIEIVVKDGATPDAAEQRIEVIAEAVMVSLTADPALLAKLNAPAGWQIIDAVLVNSDGPGPVRGREDAQCYRSFEIHVHARKS